MLKHYFNDSKTRNPSLEARKFLKTRSNITDFLNYFQKTIFPDAVLVAFSVEELAEI